MRECKTQGCGGLRGTRGFCDTCYRRWRRAHGYKPPVRSWSDPTVRARFWAKAQPADTGCWEWSGALNSKGYGLFMLEGSAKLAHRVAWEACEGPIPAEMTIDHLCFNRVCVNPAHMEVVSRSENARRGAFSPNRRRVAA